MSSATSRRRLQQSILSLDKSDEPFTVQLAQACNILEIDLDEQWKAIQRSTEGLVLQQNAIFDPRTEWVLRWLLKKIELSDIGPGSPHLKPKLWLMLQELAVRTPLSTLSRLLRAHHFTSALRGTLGWLQEHVNRAEVSPDVGVGNEEMLDPPDDSSDTVGSSSSGLRMSRKRKLDGTEIVTSKEMMNTATGAFRVLYLAICAALRQLQSLAMDSEKTQDFAVEHMKSSLRSCPDEAAQIVGSSFYLTNRLIQTPQRHWHQRRIFTKELQKLLADSGYGSCIFPTIGLWNRRSLVGQHSSPTFNNAFVDYSMLPTLQLLDTCRRRPSPNQHMIEVIKSLEDLVIDQAILPLRNAFLSPEPATDIENQVSITSFCDNMVSLLRRYFPQLESHFLPVDWKTDKHLAVSLISLLFDIAIKCRPRSTSKLRRIENPWLELFFIRLAKCAETLFPPASSIRARKDYIRVIKWMLQKAVDHQVRVGLSTIKEILDQNSGLFQENNDNHTEPRIDVKDENQVEWSLINLCILNDPDAFVIPSPSASDNETYEYSYAYRPPNKYLSALLRNITDEVRYEFLEEDEHYDLKVLHVIIPLCDAFIGVRNLTAFLEHWREQLDIVQERQISHGAHFSLVPSIWEDERLLLHVARSAESSLTAGQVNRILSIATHDQTPSSPTILNGQPMSLANLVILDCVFTGLLKEETLAKLESIALSVFGLLGVHISRPPIESGPHDWRAWRVQATITDRWSSLRESSMFKRKAHPAICMASGLIDRISSELMLHDNVNLKQELHAFRFMLKFAAMEDCIWDDLQFSSRQKIRSAVTKLLDIMEPFSDRISHDHFGTMMRAEDVSKREQVSPRISPIDKFYFDSIDAITEWPSTINYFEEATQKRFVQQLYWSSVFQQRLVSSKIDHPMDYSLGWKKLLRCDALDESRSMMRCLRNFQVDRYLSASYFNEPKYWDVAAADYVVALQSIQATPTNEFDRGQRSRLANRVLRILLLANMSKLARTTDHLVLLARLIQMPNKSINILTNEIENLGKGSAQPKDEIALIGLARRIDGVVGWSEDNVHSVRALKELARSVMGYLLSTLDQKSSIQYLQAFYGQMAHSLEHHYKTDSTCTIALSALFEASLNQLSHHRDELPDFVKQEELDTTRQYHLECILKNLDNSNEPRFNEPERKYSYGVSLECLAGYSDLVAIHPNLHDISSRLFSDDSLLQTLSTRDHDEHVDNVASHHKDCCSIEYLAVCLAKVKLRLYAYDYSLHPNLAHTSELLKSLHSSRERDKLLHYFKDVMPKLGLQSKKALCFEFQVGQEEYLDYSQLLRIQIGISSLNGNGNLSPQSRKLTVQNVDQQIGDLSVDLSKLLIVLCGGFSRRTEFSECMLSMQCVNVLFQHHPRVISQWHVDELLAAISVKAYKLNTQREEDSGRLYIGLCRLFAVLLATHRAKIGGRYHLVVPALQALQRCLFIPYKNDEAGESEGSVFGESHAAGYGRILSMICDPTVSSVTRGRKRSRLELNDETKKARSIAGQHLAYVMMDFCSCQLRGHLGSGMRAALNAGLYAVLRVIGPDMMGTMNAAMDSSSRSVFKALYEEYRKLGKWKEE